MAGAVGSGALAGTVPGGATGIAWPPSEDFRLWPGRPPGSLARLPVYAPVMEGPPGKQELHLRGIAAPIVGVYRPERPDGRALLSLPGGGYQYLSVENEGINVARTFCPLGVTVFVLAYRLPGEGWAEPQDVPLQDAQRAMRLIRARAASFAIDAAKLGCIGFSAGGLLAASLAVAHADPVYPRVDAGDAGPARPAFAGLIYPVVTGGRMRVGKLAAARFDTPARVRPDTPPLFIAHALDDPVVPFAEPMAMLTAARENGVPVEAHFFGEGGHGFGPRYLPPELPGARWPQLFDAWTARVAALRGTR